MNSNFPLEVSMKLHMYSVHQPRNLQIILRTKKIFRTTIQKFIELHYQLQLLVITSKAIYQIVDVFRIIRFAT